MPLFSVGGMRYQHSWDSSQQDQVPPENQKNLEAIIDRALEVGIHHFETARGYGTSEHQLGRILPHRPRDSFILQTKVPPQEDPEVFKANLEDSLNRLQLDYVDLFAFHGLNFQKHMDWTLRPGGCYEVALELQKQGRIKHLGFSTHAPTPKIIELLESGKFAYVNLHFYYVNQENLPALHAASKNDVGVFIISPSSVGGKLFKPSDTLVELCKPYSPMVFNDLFCLSHPEIKTLSLGAAKPEDFDEHLKAVEILKEGPPDIEDIIKKLDAQFSKALTEPYASTWKEGLPSWENVPGEVNLKTILWLGNLERAFGITDYSRERYKLLQTGGSHWFPGKTVNHLDFSQLDALLVDSPNRELIPQLLKEYHETLFNKLSLKERYQPKLKKILNKLRRIKSKAKGLFARD